MLPAPSFDEPVSWRHHEFYDEIHVGHEALSGPERDERGSSDLVVVRREDGQPRLSVDDIIERMWGWRPMSTTFDAWYILHFSVTAQPDPRCMKVVFTVAPRDDSSWRDIINPKWQSDAYFNSYGAVSPRIDTVLPCRWSWFASRVMERASGKKFKWPGSRTPIPAIQEEPLYRELKARIDVLAKADDAIWATAKRFSVNALARDLGMPRRTFERRLEDWNTGVSPADIIHEIRLCIANEMLPQSTTVKAIANRTGYSQSHFTKVYRARFGTNPSEHTK